MRIATISDIHYKTAYGNIEYKFVKDYLNSFGEKIQELHNVKSIDAFVITGDIAFSGRNDQYKAFKKILENIIPKEIPIYSIVGNHDVNWTDLKVALGANDNVQLETLFSLSEDYIANTENEKFKDVFNDFHVDFNEDIIDSRCTGKIPKPKFCNNKYAGYVWNPEEKILFLLINSAWFSFGPGVIEEYYKLRTQGLEKDGAKVIEISKKFLGDTLSQEGKQSYFYTTFPYPDDIENILMDREVRVATFAHHPPSWLTWEEQFKKENGKRNLSDILEDSDVLVTGHLHNPIDPPSLLREKCYHVSNGAFLDYHFIDHKKGSKGIVDPIEKFPNNWFQIIEIEADGFSYDAYKFTTKKNSGRRSDENYKYIWELNSPIRKKIYPFVDKNYENDQNKLKEVLSPIDNSKKNQQLIEDKPIKTYGELVNILKEARENQFSIPNGGKPSKKIEPKAINTLKYNSDEYLIIINGLRDAYDILKEVNNYEELKNKDFFKEIIPLLEKNQDNHHSFVLAFYDFVDFKSSGKGKENKKEREDYFANFQNSRLIIYQSFKQKFFDKFIELYNFAEFNISYDLIIV